MSILQIQHLDKDYGKEPIALRLDGRGGDISRFAGDGHASSF